MKNKMQFYSRRQRLFRLQLPHFFANRKVKDRLFCYLFENDRKALLQLYNALNNSNYQDENALQIVTLDNVVYMSMKNDLAFLLIETLHRTWDTGGYLNNVLGRGEENVIDGI